ncbi:MAG: zinc ABC transporter substrate-binding protein [Clostridia bacterium]|nr:zinc ABC transporter substrate-binding protein [Clostridia bacterium]
MKKILAVLLALALVLGFAGCANKKDTADTTAASADKGEGLKIVCTIFPQYDFMRAITKGVDSVELSMLLAPGDESHSYSATLEDISTINSADLFIYVGGESDEWVEEVLKSAHPKKSIAIAELVETLEESDDGIIAQEEEEEEEGAFDEHVWTSLKRSSKIVTALGSALAELDAAHADTYSANAAQYAKQMQALDQQFTALFSTVKNKTLVIADRNPFRYFCEDYGIKAIAAFSGCSSNNEIPLSVQNELIKALKENGLKHLYVIELNSSDYADAIAKQAGAEKLVLYSCHNLSKEDFESGKTYIDFMTANYETLSTSMA